MSRIKIESEYNDLDKYKYYDGDIVYFKKNTDIYHNPYGPAVVNEDGHKEYWINNNLDRLDGPSVIYANGKEEYWINHKLLNKEEFELHPERLKFLDKEYLLCLI